MATRQEIIAAADAKLATLWSAIQTKQDAYAAAHNGRFWQGLRTASITPADGIEVKPDIGTKAPTDQLDPWPLAIRNATLPFALQIDCYDGPNGTGYVATVTITIAGQTWQRSAQVGPETYRAQPWTQQELTS